MLENIKDLVRQFAGDSVINNPAIPNDKNEEVITDASSSILDGLKNSASGGIGNVTDFFKGGSQAALNSPVTQNIQGGFMNNLMHKFGLDHGSASMIATSLIPMVLQKLVHKTNDPNDSSFNLGSILGGLTGGGGVGNILNNLGGSGTQSDDGGVLGKIKNMF